MYLFGKGFRDRSFVQTELYAAEFLSHCLMLTLYGKAFAGHMLRFSHRIAKLMSGYMYHADFETSTRLSCGCRPMTEPRREEPFNAYMCERYVKDEQ